MQLSLYPRPNACRKSTAARVRAVVLIRDQLRDRGKGPSLTARQLKRLWICSYEALRTQVTLLRKSPSTCFWSDVRSPPAMPLSWLARRQDSSSWPALASPQKARSWTPISTLSHLATPPLLSPPAFTSHHSAKTGGSCFSLYFRRGRVNKFYQPKY
ncbi:hypothetical protein V8C40DRAFT_40983 [Trichoderma camerunense]